MAELNKMKENLKIHKNKLRVRKEGCAGFFEEMNEAVVMNNGELIKI